MVEVMNVKITFTAGSLEEAAQFVSVFDDVVHGLIVPPGVRLVPVTEVTKDGNKYLVTGTIDARYRGFVDEANSNTYFRVHEILNTERDMKAIFVD